MKDDFVIVQGSADRGPRQGPLAFLANHPQFQQLRAVVQSNPNILHAMIQASHCISVWCSPVELGLSTTQLYNTGILIVLGAASPFVALSICQLAIRQAAGYSLCISLISIAFEFQ